MKSFVRTLCNSHIMLFILLAALASPPLVAYAADPLPPPWPSSCPTLAPGDMVKVRGTPAIYVVNSQHRIFFFPTGDEFKSWNMDDVYAGYYVTISQNCFDDLPVPVEYPAAVNFRAGSFIVKKATSDQLYAVLPKNSLAPISASAAAALYGNYQPQVIHEIFWPHYVGRGASIVEAKAHEGMLLALNGKTWYVDRGLVLREVTEAGFSANRFKQAFVRPATNAIVAGYFTGGMITGYEADISDRTGD